MAGKRDRKKRKTVSESSPDLPQPKKPQSNELDAGTGEKEHISFARSFLDSLQNREIKDALISIFNEALVDQIRSLEERSLVDHMRIATLEAELEKVKSERATLQSDLRDLQQYTRRNALRIYNPSWKEPQNTYDEDTDALVLQLAGAIGVRLAPWEIGRSHRVGRKRLDGTPRPVIVKFIGYNVRKRLYDARKKLRETPGLNGVYMNEDLTRENSELAYEARKLKRQRQIYDTFTRDCRVYIKRTAEDRPIVIRDVNHLWETLGRDAGQIGGRGRRTLPVPADDTTNDNTAMSASLLQLPPGAPETREVPMDVVTSTPAPTGDSRPAAVLPDISKKTTGNVVGPTASAPGEGEANDVTTRPESYPLPPPMEPREVPADIDTQNSTQRPLSDVPTHAPDLNVCTSNLGAGATGLTNFDEPEYY